MGGPALLASLAVARGVTSYIGQQQMSKQVQASAQSAYDNDIAALNERQDQERKASIEQMNKAGREALKAKATARVQGGEQGISITSLLQDLSFQQSENVATIGQNFGNVVGQIKRQALSSAATAQSQMNSAPRPSLFGTALDTAVSAGTSYYGAKAASIK